eukprot:scaffold10164_cov259-Chaetoceros_neogracile.AAC.20
MKFLHSAIALVAAASLASDAYAFTAPRIAPSIVRSGSAASPLAVGKYATKQTSRSELNMNMFSLGKNNNAEKSTMTSMSKRKRALKLLCKTATTLSILALVTSAVVPPPALAAAKDAVPVVEHLHVGQKVANYFRSFGLPDLVILAMISAMPVIELRGAVPVGLWMGLPITSVLPACVFGNMVPIIPLLFLLKNDSLKKLMKPILDRAEKKSSALGVGSLQKQWASLAAFVGIPLPGTGAWTGAMGAFLLGMPTAVAISSIFTGVVSAGVIMSAITLSGKKGGLAALAVLAAVTGKQFLSAEKEEVAAVDKVEPNVEVSKQDFLEADPYWDQSSVPVNVHKNKAPFTGKVVSTKRIVGPKATGETCHVVIDHEGDFPYWEGQSWG